MDILNKHPQAPQAPPGTAWAKDSVPAMESQGHALEFDATRQQLSPRKGTFQGAIQPYRPLHPATGQPGCKHLTQPCNAGVPEASQG